EISEYLSSLLKKSGIKHNVLNAKYHEKEAQIIAEAGKLGSVTIATNMAGRGTDIVLGGSCSFEKVLYEQVVSLGGLKIIGTERHESRRIDNQLRGRSGRQGDPGSSQFYLSLEDDLIRIFISDRVASMLSKLTIREDEAIEHDFINKAIENAQKKVECYNFDIRKQLLEFDNVVDEQRKVIYERRDYLIFSDDISILVNNVIKDVVLNFASHNLSDEKLNSSDDLYFLINSFNIEFGLKFDLKDFLELKSITIINDFILDESLSFYNNKRKKFGDKNFFILSKILFLRVLDIKWKEHLASLEQLKKSIHLRGYANKDPKNEYKIEAFMFFEQMLEDIKYEFVVLLFKLPFDIVNNDVFSGEINRQFNFDSKNVDSKTHLNNSLNKTIIKKKIGRNSLCYCGSKKKYKQCHGIN
ncbi:MAG: SEC-C domain-containing protein, partial [Pelagibacterales bacterium]|nr:SEC-C domain-containing protein [Pelagibacterales bacterium]